MSAPPRDPWRQSVPPLLGEMADAAARVAREVAGMDAEQADYLGYHVMRAIAELCGGTQVYIPKADSIERCTRDEAIWRDFRGGNVRELAQRYRVTEVHIYRILKRMRALDIERRQGQLPLGGAT